MKYEKCRFCENPVVYTFVDLGISPLSNAFLKPDQISSMEPFYPLHTFVCEQCFVADGISAFFSLREVSKKRAGKGFTMHLYDSWGSMRETELLEGEAELIGNFSHLSLERTKRNLSEFHNNLIFHWGYIPEALDVLPEPPRSVQFMHIDINSALPTKSLLEFFWPRLVSGGVILFDDYGWAPYKDTKNVIDAFFADKHGILMKIPTGQAIYYR